MNNNLQSIRDNTQKFLAWLSAAVTILVCFGILLFLFVKGFQSIDINFLTSNPDPSLTQQSKGGIVAPMVGTFVVTILGILIALPWSLSTAIYLSEYAKNNWITSYFRLAIDVLAGVPTIVIAIFGLALFTNPVFGFLSTIVETDTTRVAFGRSFFCCSIGMAIMILPYVTKSCEEAIKAVPHSYREASLALGASKWHTIVNVVLSPARKGIITAVILGMGRIIGDTAIVWLLLGGTIRMTGQQPWWHMGNWLSTMKNTGATLTSYIYFNSPAGEGNKPEFAFGAALILMLIIILLNTIVDIIGSSGSKFKEE